MTKREERILQKYASMTEQELEAAKKYIAQTQRELIVVEKYMPKTRNDKAALHDEQNKTLSLFIENITADEIVGRPTNFIYIYYWYYCMKHGKEVLTHIEFSRRMTKFFGWKIVDKKIDMIKCRVFWL